MDPDEQLQLSMRQRAQTVPAEVLYRSIPNTVHHLVYNHRSEERMLVVRDDQIDRLFIQRESYEQLQRTGIQFIHLGVLQVRLQILHRQQTEATALVLFRDTRFTDDRSIKHFSWTTRVVHQGPSLAQVYEPLDFFQL